MRTSFALLVIAAAGGVAAAAPASADTGRLADFDLAFTTPSLAAPTGMKTHVLLHRANDPNAKPAPLRSAVIHAPAGIRFDTTALPQCKASDDELRLLGSDACPHETELTVGSFSAMTGFGPPVDPLAGDDHVFNGPGQLIEVITAPGASASPAFDRLTISGSTLTAHPPVAPGGPPEGESSVRSIDFAIPVRAAGGKSLITTPGACPSAGFWSATATFGFADGTKDTVGSSTPCDRPAARPSRKQTCRKHGRHHATKRCRRHGHRS
jgi:hypothetical protein